MITIAPGVEIDEREFELNYLRASGPGGQNVNKVETAAQLRFDVRGAVGLPAEVAARLLRLAGRLATRDGELVITARRYRTQERNRQDAIDRLLALIRRAAETPRPRKATRPTPASRRRRLEAKGRRAQIKAGRASRPDQE